MKMNNKILEIKNISKSFYTLNGEIKAIEDVSFEVYEGEFLSIVGSSGCGKSTLLNIISYLDTQTSGSFKYSKEKPIIGYMLQEDALLPWFNILDNALLGLELRKIKTKDQNIYFWDRAVQKYGLEKFFNQYNIFDRRTFQKYIYSLKNTCRHLIHTYSGMREAEALSLKTNCYMEENSISILVGITSKLEGKETIVRWITSSEIKKVIDLLNEFNKLTAKSYNLDFDIQNYILLYRR